MSDTDPGSKSHHITAHLSPLQVRSALAVRTRPVPFRSESEVYSYGTVQYLLYSHGNRLQQSPLTTASPPSAQGCHHVSVLDGASHARSLKKISFPSYPRFRHRHAHPTWVCASSTSHVAPACVSSPGVSTAPHESVGQNTVSGSARVETVSISVPLPRHRPC